MELKSEQALPVDQATAWDALKAMGQRQLSRLPVVRDGVLVGCVSQEDLVRELERRERQETRRPGPWLGGRGHESPT